jgi:lipid A 3-O-deacylase
MHVRHHSNSPGRTGPRDGSGSAPLGGRAALPRQLAVALVTAAIGLALPGTGTRYATLAAQARPFEAVFENDAMTSWIPGRDNSDHEYSHGLWFGVESGEGEWLGRLFPEGAPCHTTRGGDRPCLITRLEVGQKIFTPRISEPDPPVTERPYAGWLFGAASARVVGPRIARSYRVEVGVTGAPSLGEHFQRFAHWVTQFNPPAGWDHQLGFEPALLVRYGERRLIGQRGHGGGRVADVIASGELDIGTVRTGATAGLMLRAGYRLPHPWMPKGSAGGPSVYGYAEMRQRWTGRDLFLDGNTFRESVGVDKVPFTRSMEVGIAAQYRGMRAGYSMVFEDRLYRTQPEPHLYSSVRISFHP